MLFVKSKYNSRHFFRLFIEYITLCVCVCVCVNMTVLVDGGT